MARLSQYNEEFELAGSATRSGTTVHDGQENKVHRGVTVVVNATASTGDGTEDLDVNIQYQDPVSATWLNLIAIVGAFQDGGTGIRRYIIYPGISDKQANFDASQDVPLPETWRVETIVQPGGTSPDYTYSVGILMMV